MSLRVLLMLFYCNHAGFYSEVCQSQSNNTRSCFVCSVHANNSTPCLKKTYPSDSTDTTVFFSLQTTLDSSKPPDILVISENGILKVSCMIINALSILDVVLSRRTKPWKFVLRVLYRVGRSNLKWGLLWAAFQLWYQFERNQTSGTIEVAADQLPFTAITTLYQMQQLWTTVQTHPVLLTMTFLIYNLMVSWVLHRLIRRNDNRNVAVNNESLHAYNSTTAPINGTRNVSRRILSGWTLLIDCLFRPLSLDTAQSLMDFELDENLERLIERLALPNLWLTPTVPTDYQKYLPVWRFECWSQNSTEHSSKHSLGDDHSSSNMKWIPSADCAICLDKYRYTVDVCGLPCGHQFHHNCIMVWLQRDNHHCPICRWPAYQNKYLSVM